MSNLKILFAFFSIFLGATVNADHIVKLTPPIITPSTVKAKVACTRPMRYGKFNISSKEMEGKLIIHCYGHGGSGCTTLFGTVKKAIEHFESHKDQFAAKPIQVIGAGIIGLTAAIELTHKGYPVASITAKELYDIPSWKNAGYFALVSIKTSGEEVENMRQIGRNSFMEFQKIEQGEHPYILPECVKMLPVYCSEDTEAGVEDLEAAGLIPPKESVTLDFGNGVVHENFVKHMTYFMDITQIMIQLRQEVERLEIPIIQKEVSSFTELEESVVFNCSGIGAKELNDDTQMIPVRGHLFNLNEDAGSKHLEYMIYTKVKDEDGQEKYVYMFPKCLQVTAIHPEGEAVKGTLGGTFIPIERQMSEKEQDALDRIEFQKLMERTTRFFWG